MRKRGVKVAGSNVRTLAGRDTDDMIGNDFVLQCRTGENDAAVDAICLPRAGEEQPAGFHAAFVGITKIRFGNFLGEVGIRLKKIPAVEKPNAVLCRDAAKSGRQPNVEAGIAKP